MGRKPELPKCYDARPDCFTRTVKGGCFCLESTYPENECPFYKTEDKVKHLVRAREYKEAKDNVRDPLEETD